jgi:hypothetical protein
MSLKGLIAHSVETGMNLERISTKPGRVKIRKREGF